MAQDAGCYLQSPSKDRDTGEIPLIRRSEHRTACKLYSTPAKLWEQNGKG